MKNNGKIKSILTGRMLEAIKLKGFNAFFIFGKKGSGKSTYAMLLAYSILESWDDVLNHIVFRKAELLEKLNKCYDETGKVVYRYPVIIWDDATYELMRERRESSFHTAFAKLMTVIRSVVANFIFTGPSFNLLASKLKDLDWVVIRIKRLNKYESIAIPYEYSMSPNGRIYIKRMQINGKPVKERFRFDFIPTYTRQEYERLRDSYSYQAFILLKNVAEKIDKDIPREILKEKLKKLIDEWI